MNAETKYHHPALINKSYVEQYLSLTDTSNFCDTDCLRIFKKFGGKDDSFNLLVLRPKEDLITIRSKEIVFHLEFTTFKNSYRKVMEDLKSQVQAYQDEHNLKLFIKYVYFRDLDAYHFGNSGYFILHFQPLYCDYQI